MKKLIALFLILFVGFQLGAQTQLDFDKLSMEDGFSSNGANVILQDRKGFIWIGTWNGLNKYNGYKCKVYNPKYHDAATISNREVTELIEDYKGNIWIGTSSGLNCLNPETDEITRYEVRNRINTICEDSEHIIWVGTNNGGLYRVDPEIGEIKHYLNSETINDILEDSSNNLWLASHNGLLNFNRYTRGFVRFLPSNKPNSISHKVAFSLAESKNGNLWVGTWGGGLNKIILHPNSDSIQFIQYHTSDRVGSLSSEVVHKMYYDQYDNLWMGTWAGGLNLLRPAEQLKNPQEAYFEVFQNNINDPYSISNNTISAILVDHNGELWVGADYINRTSIIDIGITRYKNELFENQILNLNYANSVAYVDDKVVASTVGDIVVFKSQNGQLKITNRISDLNYEYKGSYNYARNVLSIDATNDKIIVGTEGGGVLIFDKKEFLNTPDPDFEFLTTNTNPSIPDYRVKVVKKSRKYPDTFWLGLMHDSFVKLTINKNSFDVKVYAAGSTDKNISDKNIRDICEDSDGMVWIGTQKGLNCFNPETETFEQFYYDLNNENTINDDVVNSVFEDSKNTIWVGTNSGLNKLVLDSDQNEKRTIKFQGYPQTKYLSNEIIQNIVEDENKNLWLGLFKGMVQFNTVSEKLVDEYFFKEFYNLGLLINSGTLTGNGSLVFGGTNGLLSFHPDSLLMNSSSPHVLITDVKIFNDGINKVYQDLDKTVPYLNEVVFTHKDKILTFEFAALDFKNPKKNVYYYLLEGYDKQWNNIGTRNSATYTSLPAGDYTLKVKAVNSDGVRSEEPATLKIKIKPPWWKTYFAYIIYVIIVLGLLYFFKEYSIVQVKEKSKILLEKVKNEEYEKLNELKAQFFTDVTHEFRTPLTLILGPAKELSHMKDVPDYAVKQAGLIQRNAEKMLRLINQLMEYRKVAKGKMELYLQKCDITKLVNETYESFKPMSESKNVQLLLNIKQSEITAVVDIDKFEKIIYNLISNAVKYSKEGGKIVINVAMEEGVDSSNLIVKVEDTGIGIGAEHIDKIFNRFYQVNQGSMQSTGGIGLYLTKQFVEQHGGNITVESEPGKGSCFKISIPASGLQPTINKTEEADQQQVEVVENIPTEETDKSLVKPSILVVEDDEDMNDFIVSGLESNFKIINAFNGVRGLELARKSNPDIIITDIMMPEMDGFELATKLQEDITTSHIPVVFLTAKTMQDDEIKGLKIGAVDYIYKPFNLVSLRLKIENILDNRRSVHEQFRKEQLLKPEDIELSSLDEKFLKEAVEAVNKNLDDPKFDVEKFSQEIGISANQAYRKLKSLTGQTAKEFIRNQRLKTAASLFLQKKRSISEVIYMVGFSSPSYFTRCFKEYYGCTPKEYIEKEGNSIS